MATESARKRGGNEEKWRAQDLEGTRTGTEQSRSRSDGNDSRDSRRRRTGDNKTRRATDGARKDTGARGTCFLLVGDSGDSHDGDGDGLVVVHADDSTLRRPNTTTTRVAANAARQTEGHTNAIADLIPKQSFCSPQQLYRRSQCFPAQTR